LVTTVTKYHALFESQRGGRCFFSIKIFSHNGEEKYQSDGMIAATEDTYRPSIKGPCYHLNLQWFISTNGGAAFHGGDFNLPTSIPHALLI